MREYILLCFLAVAIATSLGASIGTCNTCSSTEPPKPIVRCPDCVNRRCQRNVCNEAIILPHPDNCTKFCACDPAGAIEMECPPGLEFNRNTLICDWPGDNCNIDGPYPGCNAPFDPSATLINEVCPPTTTYSSNPIKRCPQCASDQCTPSMCNQAVIIPYPNDCSKFCMCDSTGAIEMDCPPGLEYDPSIGACNWPDLSACSDHDPYPGCNAPTTTTSTTTTTTTTKPATTSTTTTPPTTTTTKPVTTTTTTPPTTTTTRPVTTTTTIPPTTTTTQPATTTTTTPPTTTTTQPINDDPVETTLPCQTESPSPIEPCPSCVNHQCVGNPGKLLPYPQNCFKFCMCTESGSTAMDCAPGLVFDPKEFSCVYSDDYPCSNEDPYPGCNAPNVTTTPGPATTTTSTKPPKPLTRCPDCVNQFCTPNMCNQAVLIPFPGDCNKYCVCDHGGAIEMECSPGMIFEPSVKTCVNGDTCNLDPYNPECPPAV